MQWRLAEAKNRFSEVVNRALSEGPQTVSRRNDSVVILSQQEYDRLSGNRPGFKEFLLKHIAPLDDLELSRDKSPMRDIDL